MISANEVRQQFIDFFVKKYKHTFVPSSPVVPLDDPTLLFSNAGMNQFKPIFLGLEKRPYTRVANTQKCIRAGGKHNDLDDVGRDTYHHTFFEMLGNWSFGDYFKKEAIQWAWELLTEVWKLDPERLHVTVFGGDPNENLDPDEEAKQIWIEQAGVPPERVHYGSKKDNFWEMGNTGPCGPCTEIHIDKTPDKSGRNLVNAGVPEVMEIWNLVFIQFNRGEDGKLTPLPAKHVDTGMGFERITAVLQKKESNYDTDVFTPIFQNIQKITQATPYTGVLPDLKDTAYRVIADHIRTLTFALTDGATIGNDGRNYVLKRILRRAARYGRQYLGAGKPFLCELVLPLVEHMGSVFPELKQNPSKVAAQIESEEKQFLKTLDRGLKLFAEIAKIAQTEKRSITGAEAFKLHGTYGFTIDLTQQMADEVGLKVDMAEYETLAQASQGGGKSISQEAIQGELPKTDDSFKYQGGGIAARLLGWVKHNTVITSGTLQPGDEVALLFDRTNFYGEQGGQVGDTGTISKAGAEFEVTDTQRLGDAIAHIGIVLQGTFQVGDVLNLMVNPTQRRDIVRNHSATHLLNLALRQVLGNHVDQKGSLVDADKTRFDFSHDKPLTPEEIAQIETRVNENILADLPISAHLLPLSQAKTIPGVRAVFGEKYPDPVRVVLMGADDPSQVTENMSVEFCGGTHLPSTGSIGLFKIISQEGVSKGVRRITAVTGRGALGFIQQTSAILDDLQGRFNAPVEDLPRRIASLQEELKKLQKQIEKGTLGDLNTSADTLLSQATNIGETKVIVGELPTAPIEAYRSQVDRIRQKAKSCVIVFGYKNEDGTAGLVVGVSEDVINKGLKSIDIIKPIAEIINGKGGGPPHLATAGGKDASQLSNALTRAKELVREKLRS